MATAFLNVLKQPLQNLPLPPPNSFAGKRVLITGGNSGLGLEAAKHIARLGAKHIIIGARNAAKGDAAKSTIEAELSDPSGVVEAWALDMDTFASVTNFAKRASELAEPLDCVFLNAGVATTEFKMSSEGWETCLQVNVLSTALLGLLLLQQLLKTATAQETPPHMILTSSGVHFATSFGEHNEQHILQTLNSKENFEGKSDQLEQYMISKLLDIYITQALAKLVPVTEKRPAVVVNCIDPGMCKSDLTGEMPFPMSLVLPVFGRTVEMGSRNLLAAAHKGVETHGKYIANTEVVEPSWLCSGEDGERYQRKVWEEVVEVLGAAVPEAREFASLESDHAGDS